MRRETNENNTKKDWSLPLMESKFNNLELKTDFIILSIEPTKKRLIRELSRKDKRTMSNFILNIIDQYLNQLQRDKL